MNKKEKLIVYSFLMSFLLFISMDFWITSKEHFILSSYQEYEKENSVKEKLKHLNAFNEYLKSEELSCIPVKVFEKLDEKVTFLKDIQSMGYKKIPLGTDDDFKSHLSLIKKCYLEKNYNNLLLVRSFLGALVFLLFIPFFVNLVKS